MVSSIANLFAEASTLPREQWPAFLDLHCPAPAIRQQLERLLDADRHADGFFDDLRQKMTVPRLETASNDAQDDTIGYRLTISPADEHDLWIGKHIGHYRIVELLERSAKSALFLAERTQPDGVLAEQEQGPHPEAVVVLAPQPAARDAVHYSPLDLVSKPELQALRQLEHPALARLLESGHSNEAGPFLTFELPEGVSINTYCDQRCLSVRQRIALFLQVCDAINYAHRKLTAHGALHPSRVRVDSSGRIHLSPCGIARLITLENLAFAAPERRSKKDHELITVASDVYSLGALLHLLLAGEPPVPCSQGNDHRQSAAQHHSLVENVLAPSEALRALPETQRVQLAHLRGVTAKQYVQQLDDDLDTITLRALEHDPARRTPSVEVLVRDLERHQQGFSLQEGTASPSERALRWVSNHRVATLALCLLLCLGLAGIAGALISSNKAQRREHEVIRQLGQAQEVQQFFLSMFDPTVFDPTVPVSQGAVSVSEAAQLPLHELLDRAVQHRTSNMHANPEKKARNPALQQAIGEAYEATGDLQSALRHFQLAYASLDPEDRDGRFYLATNVSRFRLLSGNDPSSIVDEVRSALTEFSEHAPDSKANKVPPGEDTGGKDTALLVLNAKDVLAQALLQTRSPEALREATSILRSVVEERRQEPIAPGPLSTSLVMLSRALDPPPPAKTSIKDRREAHTLLREARTLLQETASLDSQTAEAILAVGYFVLSKGEAKAAYQIFESLRSNVHRLYADHHPLVAQALLGRAKSSLAMNDPEAAENDYQTSLQVLVDVGQVHHPAMAEALTGLSYLSLQQVRLEQAQEFARRAQLPIHNPSLRSVGRSHLYLARVVQLHGEANKSLRFYQRALDKLSTEFHPDDPFITQGQGWLNAARCEVAQQQEDAIQGDPLRANGTASDRDSIRHLRELGRCS